MKTTGIRAMALTLALGAGSTAWALEGDLAAKASQYTFQKMADGTVYLNAEKAARSILGDAKDTKESTLAELVIALAERLPEGAALHLGDLGALTGGRAPSLDLRKIKDKIVITGNGGIVLGGGQKGLQVLCGPSVEVKPAAEGRSGPLEDFTMLYGNCTRISGDVKHSAFIAAVNGWASYAFKADARIDDTLFLWFSINWTFADYNAHLKNPSKEWWKDNCQAYFDLKGGGKNTRVYLMVETDYGNPGTGVWLKDCDGLALYHGATERGSSQGPGCYYLQNCRNVQLGLRRIFPGTRGGGQAAMPTHAITIEGGSGNILHAFTDFANSYGESIVNSDPHLQLWSASFDYEAKGVDAPGIVRFAYTPLNNMPEGPNVEAAAAFAEKNAAKWVKDRNKKSGLPDTPENVDKLKALIKAGRDTWWPINARHEETLVYGGQDLTKSGAKLGGGLKLPPPPSIPATDAPRSFRPLYFTWEPDFGKALLDAGADPTGKKPSDDAFAQVMFGLKADEVARLHEAIFKNNDQAAYDRLYPRDTNVTKRVATVRRPRLDIPAGTFLLSHTLYLASGHGGMLGAGPDKTLLKFTGDITAIKQIGMCGLANFTVQGGRTGVAITGVDHGAPDGLLAKSYIAGQNYYNLTFRDQTFAGMHIGFDDPEVMGGAEHDQNKYVNLTFINTGDYGIFFNNGMLDKWLCLNGTFVGQKKAGISIKHNNLIHGGVYNSSFKDIDGPGIDFMGGNATLAFRPYIVMVDQCEFVECGNAKQAAVDYGYCEVAALLRTKIVTKGKKIKCGYTGAAQQVEDVTIDVALADPADPAVVLRGVRNGQTARANGHIFRNVTASGPVAWINDANSQNEMYRKTLQRYQEGRNAPSANMPKPDGTEKVKDDGTVKLDWDVNPAAHELAPTNGWVHPFLFYGCTFGEKRYAYTLVNADVKANQVLAEVDLAPLAK